MVHGRDDADRVVEEIISRSEGVFLYVERVCEDVQSGVLSLDRPLVATRPFRSSRLTMRTCNPEATFSATLMCGQSA